MHTLTPWSPETRVSGLSKTRRFGSDTGRRIIKFSRAALMAEANVNPAPTRGRSRSWKILTPMIIGLILVCGVSLLRAVHTAWGKMLRLDCGYNLHELALACREYAAEHGGRYPSRWVDLNFTGENSNWAKLLRCPQTYHDIGTWTQVDLWADYRLIPGRSTSDAPTTILALEPLGNHASAGANVLFVDGATAWWPQSRLLGATKSVSAGTNPAR